MSQRNRYLITTLVSLLLMACAAPAFLNFSKSGEPDIQKLQISDVETFNLDNLDEPLTQANSFFPSPDGEKLAVFSPGSLCIYSSDGNELGCEEDETLKRIDPRSVNWSPDGKYIVFTEDFYRFLSDPDIWLVNVEEVRLRNLTNDGIYGNPFREEEAKVDTYPQWIEDGKKIAFVRMVMSEDENPVLCTADLEGKESCEGATIPIKNFFDLKFTRNGKRVVFTCRDEDTGQFTVYLGDTAGGEAGRWFSSNEYLYETNFSADEKYLMIQEYLPQQMNFMRARLISMEDGEEVQTVEGNFDEGTYLTHFAWSPSGSAFLYLLWNAQEEEYTLYGGKPGEDPRKIDKLSGVSRGLNSLGNSSSLDVPWAENDTILLYGTAEQEFIRLHLEEE